MPRKRGARGRKRKVKSKMPLIDEVKTRLFELKIIHQQYISTNKPIDHNDAIMYIEEINKYKEQFSNDDKMLQVISKLTSRFEAMINGTDAEITYSQGTMSSVYSEPEEDKIQRFKVANNLLNIDNEKTKTENLNTVRGTSKDCDVNGEFSESILSNYYSNVIIHTANDKFDKIAINKPLNDVALNENTVARPSHNTSIKRMTKPKKILEERFSEQTASLNTQNIFDGVNVEIIKSLNKVKEPVEANVNNISQAVVPRNNEDRNDEGNNIFNCKSTETLCVQSDDNKSETQIQNNKILINDITVIRKPVLESKDQILFNKYTVAEHSYVATCSLNHRIGTSNTENIEVVLENNETKANENFVIPKPADVIKNPKLSRKKPMKPKKDKDSVVKGIIKVNNKKDKSLKIHKIELTNNSTIANTEQKSSTNCDLSNNNLYISETECFNNRLTKKNELMNEDLSWIEKIKRVRIIDEEEYDPRLNNLNDSFWTDSSLPTECSVNELFD